MEALDWSPFQASGDDSGRSAHLVAHGSNYPRLHVHSIDHIHKKLSMSMSLVRRVLHSYFPEHLTHIFLNFWWLGEENRTLLLRTLFDSYNDSKFVY